MNGGRMTLPRESRARMYSASVMRAPAASTNVYVVANGIDADGMKMNMAAMIVANNAQMLKVSRERRRGATED